MNFLKSTLLALVALVSFNGHVVAADYSHSVLAAQGYDVVSYQVAKRPVRGNGHFVAQHDGATYQFSSKENLQTFNADPQKYVPAYNGYCAYGVAVGKKFIGDPEVWRVVDGKTYLNLDVGVQAIWLEETEGNIKAADTNWTKIVDKDPASL